MHLLRQLPSSPGKQAAAPARQKTLHAPVAASRGGSGRYLSRRSPQRVLRLVLQQRLQDRKADAVRFTNAYACLELSRSSCTTDSGGETVSSTPQAAVGSLGHLPSHLLSSPQASNVCVEPAWLPACALLCNEAAYGPLHGRGTACWRVQEGAGGEAAQAV